MDGSGGAFRVDFTRDGEARLRERVKEKLKEFIADDSDDTLVEYVVILLRNGRHKDEAVRELHVFLGDDSFLFVTWLWNHLSLNTHLYVDSNTSMSNEVDQIKSMSNHLFGGQLYSSTLFQADLECGMEKSTRISRIQRNREWKGSVRGTEPFPDQGIESENIHLREKKHHMPSIVKRLPSPKPQLSQKRARREEQLPKRDTAVPSIGAPRRLLQFAVRDAVRTVQQSNSKTELASKRLHSVVSASTADRISDEKPHRPRSTARITSALSAAIKAAAEAAEDVSKTRCPRNVFGRLGYGKVKIESSNRSLDYREADMDEEGAGEPDQMPESYQATHYHREEYAGDLIGSVLAPNSLTGTAVGSAAGNDGSDEGVDILSHLAVNSSQAAISQEKENHSLMLQCSVAQDADNIRNVPVSNRNTRANAGFASDNDESDEGVDILSYHNFNSSQTITSAEKEKDSLMVQCSVAQDADSIARKTRPVVQDGPANEGAKSSSKIVNISVNVNTWKPLHYHRSNVVIPSGKQNIIGKCEESILKSNGDPKERNNEKEKEEACANVQKDPQKIVTSTGSYMTGRPLEDLDSRTVYVYNVHFAATKDALSCHFNKFGEVLKVVNMTDAATGQPTGYVYVEFLRKESAELALSLNGTSFMSRILKVVQRSSVPHEVAAMIDWSRGIRPSPYSSRLCRAPYARGLRPAAFGASLPLKSGARSLQWKRDASNAQTSVCAQPPQDAPVPSPSSAVASGGNNLTFVRTQFKAEGSDSPA